MIILAVGMMEFGEIGFIYHGMAEGEIEEGKEEDDDDHHH
jgi:hypothetical protein